jgi:hypothetical protein
MSDIFRWRGNAIDIADIWEFTVTGDWAMDDQALLTINDKTLIVQMGDLSGTGVGAADVAEAIVAAWNGTTEISDEVRNTDGSNIPEFAELTAELMPDGVTVRLTGNTEGVPHIISVSETTVGTGALGPISNIQVATGKNFGDNPVNWDLNVVPDDANDIIYIENSNIPILYGIDWTGDQVQEIKIRQNFTAAVGLPQRNANGYDEYRNRYWKVGCPLVTIGEGEGQGSGRILINNEMSTVTTVRNSGSSSDAGLPAILLLLTDNSTSPTELNVLRGSVGVALLAGETSKIDVLRQSYISSQGSDSDIILGLGVELSTSEITKSGGTLTINSTINTLLHTGGVTTINEGSATSLIVDNGTVYYRGSNEVTDSGVITNAKCGSGGGLVFDQDLRPRTITNMEIHTGGTLLDREQTVTFTNGIDFVRCGLDATTVDLGEHFTMQRSVLV